MRDNPIARQAGTPLGEFTHNNNIIGPVIGVGGTTYNLITLKSTIISQPRCHKHKVKKEARHSSTVSQ